MNRQHEPGRGEVDVTNAEIMFGHNEAPENLADLIGEIKEGKPLVTQEELVARIIASSVFGYRTVKKENIRDPEAISVAKFSVPFKSGNKIVELRYIIDNDDSLHFYSLEMPVLD